MTCPTVTLDLASPYATLLDPMSPTEITRRGCDWSDWLACNNPGATITGATWAVQADDDDGFMGLSQEVLASGLSSVLLTYTGTTLNVSYRLINTVTLNDGQSIPAYVQVSVRDVWKQALAA